MTSAEQQLIERYRQTGRVVSVVRKRDGRVFVSLNGIQMSSEKALQKIRDYFARQPNPDARHSAKWDRCVKDVKRSGTATNAYAVCTRALGEGAYHKGRASNPLTQRGPIELTAVWTGRDGKEHTVFQRFPSVEKARTAARRLVIAMNRATGHPTRYNIRRRVPFNP